MTANSRKLYQVILPYAVFGVDVTPEGIIGMTAPMGAWARGKRFTDFEAWVMGKGGRIIPA